jgi:hypothetical protein
MLILQQADNRSLECVWTPSGSGKGLSCNWVERRVSAAAAESRQDGSANSQRKVA